VEGKPLQQLLRRADFDGSVDRTSGFATMETVELADVDGKVCHRVRMMTARSDTVFACFDVDTGLMSSMEVKEFAMIGDGVSRMWFSDYADFGGLRIPTRTTTWVGDVAMVTTVKSVSYEPIAASEFTPPEEVRALIRNRPAAPRN
jgi:hypothetical protein